MAAADSAPAQAFAPRADLLLTTRRPGAQPAAGNALLLGPWCLTTAEEVRAAKTSADPRVNVVPYHWDDRRKFARDYEYLQALHHRMLDALVPALNALHEKAESRRYWQLLVDPWLLAYVAVQFDRWECLRVALAEGRQVETPLAAANEPLAPPFCYAEFNTQSFSDAWNDRLCTRILRYQYLRQLTPRTEPSPFAPRRAQPAEKASVLSRAVTWLDGALAPLSRGNDVAFLESYFSMPALAQLSWRLRLVPRLYRKEFPALDRASLFAQPGLRMRLRADLAPANGFETYLQAHLARDLPESVIEYHRALTERARTARLRPKIIVTASAHWSDPAAKAWMAERVSAGTKLLILNHGGSLPAYGEFFDFEQDIADLRGTWFRSHHPRQRQVPPSKLVGRASGRRGADPGRFCLVVANEYPQWTMRAHFCPMGAQGLLSFEQTIEFARSLSGGASTALRIRPAPDLGWNLARSYAERLGNHVLMQGGPLVAAFPHARLIVCTYPETTFCEAIATGRPTILLYPDTVYERHPSAAPIMEKLRAAGILFHDPVAAASHVSSIWSDLDAWWKSEPIVQARDAFVDTAMRIRGDWLSEWVDVLRAMLTEEVR
jgi:putative transferase (TIGR04331 family)